MLNISTIVQHIQEIQMDGQEAADVVQQLRKQIWHRNAIDLSHTWTKDVK